MGWSDHTRSYKFFWLWIHAQCSCQMFVCSLFQMDSCQEFRVSQRSVKIRLGEGNCGTYGSRLKWPIALRYCWNQVLKIIAAAWMESIHRLALMCCVRSNDEYVRGKWKKEERNKKKHKPPTLQANWNTCFLRWKINGEQIYGCAHSRRVAHVPVADVWCDTCKSQPLKMWTCASNNII